MWTLSTFSYVPNLREEMKHIVQDGYHYIIASWNDSEN